MTEQGLNEDDIRRRDEEAKIDRIHYSHATEQQRWKTHTSYREIVELMVEILAKTADTQIMKKQRKICAVFEPPILCNPTKTTTAAAATTASAHHRGNQSCCEDQWQSPSSSLWKEHSLMLTIFFLKDKPQKQHIRGRTLPSCQRASSNPLRFSLCVRVLSGRSRHNPSHGTHFPRWVYAHASLHADAHFYTPQDFVHQAFVVLKKKSYQSMRLIAAMRFHDNPTDTLQHRAHTLEVTHQKHNSTEEPQALREVRRPIRPNYIRPQVMSPTCTTRTNLRTSTCLSPTTRCKVQPPVLEQKTPQRHS